ncbi:MAG: hypothetical protein P4L67_02110 [Candidatus Pacebacteria bacterium]|nr:hypothetical protein [Candidatus Paceibacterota bacterium]
MLAAEESRKNEIRTKMQQTDEMVHSTQARAEKERKKKYSYNVIKRTDRQETVKRISKINDYQREKILERIENDNERAERIRMEKAALLDTRQKLRKEVDLQKTKVLDVFERMKRKGKIDV